MFGWLKDKVTGNSNSRAATELRALFAPLANLPRSPNRIAERLANFVLTGDDESILSAVLAMKTTHTGGVTYALQAPDEPEQKGLRKVVPVIPQDPQIFLRLAQAYDTAQQVNSGGVSYFYGAPIVPAFDGSLSWLTSFLVELSQGGKRKDPALPAGLVLAMVEASGEIPNALARGPFFYEDANGKSLLNSWTAAPYTAFQCLDQFAELIASSPDVVRPAFQQKQAGSRAHVLRALAALRVSPAPFAEEIAALAVSGSKEVRENAAPFISDHFSLFRDFLRYHAEKGSADERFHAVRLIARAGGDAEHEFLTQRLNVEKSEKVGEVLREALAGPETAQAAPANDNYDLPEVPEVPAFAPLDKQFLTELRKQIEAAENAAAIAFANNQKRSSMDGPENPYLRRPPTSCSTLFSAS